MRITFLCQYFPPEMGAPSARTYEHARYWVELGHEVTVITGFPNHPTGVLRAEYRGALVKRETVEGIELLRTWLYVTANKGFFRRLLNFFSFFFSALFFGAWLTKRPDVVIGTSPQFFCAVAAYLLSRLKRAPFVFEVRDIWPESAIELGVLRNRWLIRVLEAIELHLYQKAALIVTVAEATRPYLISKGIAPEKIRTVPNGIDVRYLASKNGTPAQVREELGLEDKFLVSYIGTHGMSHALQVVLRTAEALRHDRSLHFLFIGEGSEKENLQRLAAELRLENVTFLAEQPREHLLAFYRASDVGVVPLRRLPLFKKVLPSKLFEFMGTGCPVICGVEGEAAELVERAEAGLCIEPENVAALVAAIKQVRDQPAERQRLGRNGERFAQEHYLRSMLAERYLEALGTVNGTPWPKITREGQATDCAR